MASEGYELYSNDPRPLKVPSGLRKKRHPPAPEPESKKQAEDENEEKNMQEQQDFMRMEEAAVSMAIPEWPAELPTICEVPEDLIEGNKDAYTPKVVCIGPLFDSERTRASMVRLEHYKRCCVRKLIFMGAGSLESAAWSPKVHGLLLRNSFDTMMHLVPRIRAAYSSNGGTWSNNGNEQQLATKMLIDGCFVLHRLLKYAQRSYSSSSRSHVDDDDWTQLLGRCWVWGTVTRDLLLLSNQVPFFVIQKLFEQLRLSGDNTILVTGGLQLLSSLHPRRLHSEPIACHDVHHLLHLFYLSIDLPDQESSRRQQRQQLLPPDEELGLRTTRWVPCAKELEEAGVRFRARKHGAASFLDVRFQVHRVHGGILEIPPLQLFDYSEPLFRNLIAFEQTYLATPGRITAYAIFMDCLIKTTDDVRLLHQSGVLVNHMNGNRDDTASMNFFSRLCAEVHTSDDRNYLAGIMEEVLRYQRRKWPRWRAALVSNYFTNPWVTTSVVAAAVLLVMTAMQTVYTVYPYYNPSK